VNSDEWLEKSDNLHEVVENIFLKLRQNITTLFHLHNNIPEEIDLNHILRKAG